MPNVSGQLEAVAKNRADVAAGAVSITAERERNFDFSQPILNAGLQILVRSERSTASPLAIRAFLDLLFSKAMLLWLAVAIAITIIPAHILWLIERRHSGSMVSRSYFPGIFNAFSWGLGTLAGQGDSSPRHWLSRSLAILWAFVSIIFIALYTATLTATLTVEQFQDQINGPSDLFGKKVGTVAKTTSAAYLRTAGVAATEMRLSRRVVKPCATTTLTRLSSTLPCSSSMQRIREPA